MGQVGVFEEGQVWLRRLNLSTHEMRLREKTRSSLITNTQ